MKNLLTYLILLIVASAVAGCGNQELNDIIEKVEAKDYEQVKKATTEFGVFEIADYDSLIYLSLGEPDEIVGANGGYLILRRSDNGIIIEEFRAGK